MKLLRRVAHILTRSKRDADLREEMHFHLLMKQRELEAAGFSREVARDAARKALGNTTYHREASHDVWVAPDIESIWRDIPYALRSLRRTPSFTIAAVLALGLGTGSAAAVFSLLDGVVLAAVGIYGILSYTVSRRRREIGIRLALGAEPRAIRRMVVRQGLTMAAIGCVVGVIGAQMGAGLLSRFMYETRPSDPLTLAAVVAAVIAVALLACAVPGWRASGEDPTRALRAE